MTPSDTAQAPIPSRIIQLLILLLVVCGLVATEYVVDMARQRMEQVRRTEATAELATLRAQLEGEINSVLYLSRGLISYIAVQPQQDPQRWSELSAELVQQSPLIRNIGLAPDNVLSFIYPLAGNEKALGLDYRSLPDQWPAVERAITSGELTLAGPLTLKQGGEGIIARSPIYHNEDSLCRYWGIASVVLDSQALFAQAGLAPRVRGFDIAIRGRDGLGEAGDVFFGDAEVFTQPLVQMRVKFPDGSWVMAARPVPGAQGSVALIRIGAWLLILVFSGLLLMLLRLYRLSYHQSVSDALTGLANRRLLLGRAEQLARQHARGGPGFALFFIDLNHFKQVNDTYGHHVGDQLLIEAGRRLKGSVRQSDTLARNGGDEFILLQPGVDSGTAGRIAVKLEKMMEEPFALDGHQINISASVGVAVFPQDVGSVEAVIRLADTRMYSRKQEKRARQPIA